ncbi:MAG: SDR family oxidoreductase [Clostridiales bacterium]|jgi:NAD(P)-dependent dehydrogenase (short-subunit alcohol dehydrogenase family)|nr:SDR family oxidoreductase [Clostridiales bacterium]
MKVLITGSSKGIGRAVAILFIEKGYAVYGIDICEDTIRHRNYTHYISDVADAATLPDIPDVAILVNNAGVQGSGRDIEVNLKGAINCTEKYGIQPLISSIVNIASVSAHNGAEFPEYAASKGGLLAYTKNAAKRVAVYGATCNSISPGGVLTDLNLPVMNDTEKWGKIMDMTPLRKWATPEEIAGWIYFLAVTNKSMTGQDVLVDNGEIINHTFVW